MVPTLGSLTSFEIVKAYWVPARTESLPLIAIVSVADGVKFGWKPGLGDVSVESNSQGL